MKQWHRIFWLTVLMAQALEATAWLALTMLESMASIRYTPVVTNYLPMGQRNAIHSLLDGAGRLQFDSKLGWSLNGDIDFRALGSSPNKKDNDVVLVTGGTFAYNAVNNKRGDWLNQLSNNRTVDNSAVPGYGIDQAFIKYTQGNRQSSIVLIELSRNTLLSAGSVWPAFRTRQSDAPYAKPRFIRTESGIKLIPPPLEKDDYRKLLADPKPILTMMGGNDLFFQRLYPYTTASVLGAVQLFQIWAHHRFTQSPHYTWLGNEPLEVGMSILKEFCAAVTKSGATPVVVVVNEPRFNSTGLATVVREWGITVQEVPKKQLKHSFLDEN